MSYVAAWRANLACRLLHEPTLRLGEIAGHVGDESLPTFSLASRPNLVKPRRHGVPIGSHAWTRCQVASDLTRS